MTVLDSRPARLPTAAEQFGRAMRKLREVRGYSVRGLGKASFLTHSLISRVENGVTPPTLEAARSIDAALGAGGQLVELAEAARAEPYLHLPPPPVRFVGRDRLLGQLTGAVARRGELPAPLLALSGPPGVGKTALVLRWVHARQSDFDHVLWADLSGSEFLACPGDVLEDLLLSLGTLPEVIPAPAHQRLALLRGRLHRRRQRVLLVLDDAHDSAQVRQVLPGDPDMTVLVTSRRRLSGLVREGAVPLAVPALEETEALRLAYELIGPDQAARDPEAVAHLVRLCGAMPLAVGVAAERVAAEPHLSLREHLTQLANSVRIHAADNVVA